MKRFKKLGTTFAIAALLAAMMISASGCRGHGGGGSSYSPITQSWYDVYGSFCGSGQPRPGCNFYWNGTQVVDTSDPYFSSSYNLQYDNWYYTDSYGFSRAYTGWAWLSYTGILYDDWGNALNEDGGKDGVDVIADAAQAAQEVVKNVGKSLSDRYALAEDVSIRIATTLNDFAVIGKTRARTEADISEFTKRLYGVSVTDTTAALDQAKTGDVKALENLNGDVANYWGTNPETSKVILKKWFRDQASEYGVK